MILYLLWLMRETWNNTIWLLFKKKKTRSNNIKINQEKNLYYSSFEIYIISFQKLSIQRPPIFRTLRILQETIPNFSLHLSIKQRATRNTESPVQLLRSNSILTVFTPLPVYFHPHPIQIDLRTMISAWRKFEERRPKERNPVENWPTHWSSARNWKKRMKKKKKGEKKERRGEERQR